jgi:hypothetical protein
VDAEIMEKGRLGAGKGRLLDIISAHPLDFNELDAVIHDARTFGIRLVLL